MKPLLLPAAALLVGLALGYLLWGRGPTRQDVTDAIQRAERAEELAAQNAAQVVRFKASWLASERESDSLAKLAQKPRLVVRHSVDTVRVALERGDTAGAVLAALEGLRACGEALTLDSLALTACQRAGAARDSAISVLGVTVDSLRAANRGAVTVLKRVKPTPWAAGATWGQQGWGVQVERDARLFLPLRLSVSGLIRDEPEVRVGLLLRF